MTLYRITLAASGWAHFEIEAPTEDDAIDSALYDVEPVEVEWDVHSVEVIDL